MNEEIDVRFYQDDAGDWRWQVKAGNGEIIGASTEGYRRHIDAIANWNKLRLCAATGDVDERGYAAAPSGADG